MSEESKGTLEAAVPPTSAVDDKSDDKDNVAPTEPLSEAAEEEADDSSPTEAGDGELSEEPESESSVAKEEPVPEAPQKKDQEAEEQQPVVVTLSGRKRPPYKYDPNKVTLRFIFANRDGLTVTIMCKPADTVGEIKGALLSVWPESLPDCTGGDRLRLVCMGKGLLMPDSRTLEDCQVPVFKTHPTPVNVSVRPEVVSVESIKPSSPMSSRRNRASPSAATAADQGCTCVIL